MWKKDKEIQKIKITHNMSFPEAHRIVEASIPKVPNGVRYAQATNNNKTGTC